MSDKDERRLSPLSQNIYIFYILSTLTKPTMTSLKGVLGKGQ